MVASSVIIWLARFMTEFVIFTQIALEMNDAFSCVTLFVLLFLVAIIPNLTANIHMHISMTIPPTFTLTFKTHFHPLSTQGNCYNKYAIYSSNGYQQCHYMRIQKSRKKLYGIAAINSNQTRDSINIDRSNSVFFLVFLIFWKKHTFFWLTFSYFMIAMNIFHFILFVWLIHAFIFQRSDATKFDQPFSI